MTIIQSELPELLRIRERFVEMHHDRHDQLEVLLDAARRGIDPHTALAEARRILHKIGGTAGTLGFAAFGTAAREVEYMIDAFLDGTGFQPVNDGDSLPECARSTSEMTGIIAALDRLLDESLRVCVPDI